MSTSLIFPSESSDIVGQGFNHDFGAFFVVTIKCLIELFNVHRHRLLEQLHVLWLTHGNKHRFEGLQGALLNCLAMSVRHVLGDNREKRLDEGRESFSKILANLL